RADVGGLNAANATISTTIGSSGASSLPTWRSGTPRLSSSVSAAAARIALGIGEVNRNVSTTATVNAASLARTSARCANVVPGKYSRNTCASPAADQRLGVDHGRQP